MIYKEDIVNVELETGTIHRSFLCQAIGKGDHYANRFGVALVRNGEAVTIDGNASCQGLFMAPDGNNILISGTDFTGVSGNKAWVQLPQACYNVEGKFTLAIKVLGYGIVGTYRIIDGVVDNTGVTGAVAPVETVPTYQEIISLYNEMVAIAGAARGAAGEGNADQVDGYHAADLLTDIGGTPRKLHVRYGAAELPDDTVTAVTFSSPFPNACVWIGITPATGFNVWSAVSVVSSTLTGAEFKQKNGSDIAMNVNYIAIGW